MKNFFFYKFYTNFATPESGSAFFLADPDPGGQKHADPCRSGSGSETLIQTLTEHLILA